jgi:hypothetical protein
MEVKHQYRLRSKFEHQEKAEFRIGFSQIRKPNFKADKLITKARKISFIAITNRLHRVSNKPNRHDKAENTVVKVRLKKIL